MPASTTARAAHSTRLSVGPYTVTKNLRSGPREFVFAVKGDKKAKSVYGIVEGLHELDLEEVDELSEDDRSEYKHIENRLFRSDSEAPTKDEEIQAEFNKYVANEGWELADQVPAEEITEHAAQAIDPNTWNLTAEENSGLHEPSGLVLPRPLPAPTHPADFGEAPSLTEPSYVNFHDEDRNKIVNVKGNWITRPIYFEDSYKNRFISFNDQHPTKGGGENILGYEEDFCRLWHNDSAEYQRQFRHCKDALANLKLEVGHCQGIWNRYIDYVDFEDRQCVSD